MNTQYVCRFVDNNAVNEANKKHNTPISSFVVKSILSLGDFLLSDKDFKKEVGKLENWAIVEERLVFQVEGKNQAEWMLSKKQYCCYSLRLRRLEFAAALILIIGMALLISGCLKDGSSPFFKAFLGATLLMFTGILYNAVRADSIFHYFLTERCVEVVPEERCTLQ